jgi:hypothetical protein
MIWMSNHLREIQNPQLLPVLVFTKPIRSTQRFKALQGHSFLNKPWQINKRHRRNIAYTVDATAGDPAVARSTVNAFS